VISVYKVDSLQEIVDLFSVRPEVGTSSLYTSDINIVKSLFERSRFSSLDVNREPFTSSEHFQVNFMSEVNSDLYTGESVLYL
jgi:acyl-CoA reductase-like NAD-dependent aldehyde dehydrogenase